MLLLLTLLLAACNPQPVVLVATPIPADAHFRVYQHPTNVFKLRLPPDWSVRDVSQIDNVRVEFSPPGNAGLPLIVYVINTGQVLGTNELLDAIDDYQKIVNGDPAKYTEVSRNAQGDGSWRITGIRKTPIGTRLINTFMQADKNYLSALEIDVTDASDAQLNLYRAVINTYRVNPDAAINIGKIDANPADADTTGGALEFSGLYAWTNPQGAFIINGQVKNTSTAAIEAIRITGLLFDAGGNILAEQPEVVSAEVLEPGLSTPFSIRFRDGKPTSAVRYELRSAARYAEAQTIKNYLNDDQFLRGNELATYNADGFLTVAGDAVNKTQGMARFVKAIVAVFDESGQVVGTENVFLSKTDLLPGEAARFEVVFYELGGNAARYEVRIEGKTQ
ncbi:MAG: FxLYD domain-containing protein [Anaerolineae bacterium]